MRPEAVVGAAAAQERVALARVAGFLEQRVVETEEEQRVLLLGRMRGLGWELPGRGLGLLDTRGLAAPAALAGPVLGRALQRGGVCVRSGGAHVREREGSSAAARRGCGLRASPTR